MGALIACATHLAAIGKTYLVSDGEEIRFNSRIIVQIGCNGSGSVVCVHMFSCIAEFAGRLTGKSAQIEW